MLKNFLRKSIAMLMLIITILSTFYNIVNATEISYATVKSGEDCGFHLQFWDTKQNAWSYIITHYAYYEEGGKQYPAYCLNRELAGVEASGSYGVNVNEVMNDERLWRVAINGYPYQTPETMGVANYLDAYVATKQAIYCVIYGFDPVTRYNGGDARGVSIKNAVINLVNIGRYGTQTRGNVDVTTSKVGGFYEDGDYYSQEYLINCPVETSQYTITATNGLPNGSKITNMSNVEKFTFSGNEHFKVRIPKTSLHNEINVLIALQAKCKNYPVFYGNTTIPGTQNYMLTFDPFGDVSGLAPLNVKTNTGRIQINKTDSETSQPISGVTFQLIKEDGTVIANSTTNEKRSCNIFRSLSRKI